MWVTDPADNTAPRRPPIVWVYGGGFKAGIGSGYGLVTGPAAGHARRGYVSFSIEYRIDTTSDCQVVHLTRSSTPTRPRPTRSGRPSSFGRCTSTAAFAPRAPTPSALPEAAPRGETRRVAVRARGRRAKVEPCWVGGRGRTSQALGATSEMPSYALKSASSARHGRSCAGDAGGLDGDDLVVASIARRERRSRRRRTSGHGATAGR